MSAATTHRLEIPLSGALEGTTTSGALLRPEAGAPPSPGFVLAHGAGSDRTYPGLVSVATALAEHGHPVLLFNFAYAEAGRSRPDPMSRLEQAFRDAIVMATDRLGTDLPLVLGGRSMGGRVASHLAARGESCAGLALLAYPLHPAGKPEKLRTEHWSELRLPVLFVQGDRDALCDLELFERERARLVHADVTLHVVPGADHGFRVRRRDGRTAAQIEAEIAAAVLAWVEASRFQHGQPSHA